MTVVEVSGVASTLLLSGSVKRPDTLCRAIAVFLPLMKNTAEDPSR